jgi:uncharacterized protein YbjT (DUF2867 family)
MRVAVAGATGYVGGRLVPRLLKEGHEVRCLVRNPKKVAERPWASGVDIVQADALVGEDLVAGLQGVQAAYYLIHSLESTPSFAAADRRAAANFAAAAEAAGVEKIIYLGGLGRDDAALSNHLASRHETGSVLASGLTPVLEFRAAVIIGSGSVSFEMLRYLTEVLPVMVTPTWVRTLCQPIAISDVIEYLVAGLDSSVEDHHVVEIGGPDVLSYQGMMQTYAQVAGLSRRLVAPVPVLSPRLSSLWIGLVTPLPVAVARPLVDSLKNEVVVTDGGRAARAYDLAPTDFRSAIRRALQHSERDFTPTRWSDATTRPAQPFVGDPSWSGGTRFVDERTVRTWAPPGDVFRAFARIGGDVGYHGFDWAWRLRGMLDIVIGGVGLRRGRRDPDHVRTGDTVDFWRVVDLEVGRRMRLAADMRLPGDAWLEFEAVPDGSGSVLRQTAYFRPRGLTGRAYWYALLPFHGPIFSRMARRIVETAEDHRLMDSWNQAVRGDGDRPSPAPDSSVASAEPR